MSKELPYFRFTVSQWLNDDISLETYELKGVFIDVCSYYWFKDCSIDLATLKKRFSNASGLIDELINLEIIKVNDDESVSINFLDEQFDLLSEKRQKFVEAGRAGGLKRASNAQASLKQRSSYKDKDKDNIEERISNFRNELLEFRGKYSDELLKEFFNYWSEKDHVGKKMKRDFEKTWETSKRLITWKKNSTKFNKDIQVGPKVPRNLL